MNPKPEVPEIFNRVMRYAGKIRREVSNPYITARECIELADYFSFLLEWYMNDVKTNPVTLNDYLDQVQHYIALSRNVRENNTTLNRKFCMDKEELLVKMDKELRTTTKEESVSGAVTVTPTASKLTVEQVKDRISFHMNKLSNGDLTSQELTAQTEVVNTLTGLYNSLCHQGK